jgi:hypothetical protein
MYIQFYESRYLMKHVLLNYKFLITVSVNNTALTTDGESEIQNMQSDA